MTGLIYKFEVKPARRATPPPLRPSELEAWTALADKFAKWEKQLQLYEQRAAAEKARHQLGTRAAA